MSEHEKKTVGWVLAAQKGDRQAFDRLIQMYQRQAVAVAMRLLSNADDALEAAQDGFVRAFQALDQLQEPARFKSWLLRIVTNQALNYRRSRGRRQVQSLDVETGEQADGGSLASQLPDNEPGVTERLSARELQQQMQQAIDQLPENLRTALLLFCVEKLPQKEIAQMMNCSLQTVKWNVFEARRRLKRALKKTLEDE